MPNSILSEEHENLIIQMLQASLDANNSVPNVLSDFSRRLISEDSEIPKDIGIVLSNAICDYSNLIQNRTYLSALRKTFNLIYDFISVDDITFKIEGRRKGMINSIEKMIKLIKRGKPLDLFRDSMGIRIILFGDETESIQFKAYEITNKIIKFMTERNFTLCEADKINTDISLDKGVNILIPSESLISPLYLTSVKDYMLYPKPNGYQSLHVVFRARNMSFLEIQIRTQSMHVNAEYHEAIHSSYKTNKYGNRLSEKLDFSKIQMPGFKVISDGMIYDDIGLCNGLLVYYRTKTF